MRDIGHFLAALLLAASWLTPSAALAAKKIETAKENLSEIQQKIESLKKELDNSEAAHHEAADELKASETAISAADRKLREIALKQKNNRQQLNVLKKQSLTLNERLAQQQQQLSRLLYQQYAQGNQSYTRLLLQNKSPSQISRDVKYQSYIAKAHAKLIDDMQANLHEVKKLNQQTSAALQEVAALRAKQEAEKQQLQLQKQQKAKVLAKLSKQISSQRGEIKKLTRDEKRLSDLVERLARVIPKTVPKKSKSAAKNASQKKQKAPEIIAQNEEVPDGRDANVGFAALRGKLRLPVRGEVTNRFGSARADSGISWKGLFIRASEGADVKCVADGRIVFADWMRGFGNLVIVDHGGGYMSLYGNNQSALKHVGDTVSSGDTIAAVGNSGGNESHGLYYELRRNSKPFDPMSWSDVR